MKMSDLQFENGELVKINGMRIEYLDGYAVIRKMKELGGLVATLHHQLSEVTGTYEELVATPCASLEKRHEQSVVRAMAKLEGLK